MTKIADIREPGIFGSGRKVGELHTASSFDSIGGFLLLGLLVILLLFIPVALLIFGLVGALFPGARGRLLPQLIACMVIGPIVLLVIAGVTVPYAATAPLNVMFSGLQYGFVTWLAGCAGKATLGWWPYRDKSAVN